MSKVYKKNLLGGYQVQYLSVRGFLTIFVLCFVNNHFPVKMVLDAQVVAQIVAFIEEGRALVVPETTIQRMNQIGLHRPR